MAAARRDEANEAPMLPATTCDAVIIGGGPAGSVAARLLAAWGHSVLLLTRPIDRPRGLAESLPPSTRKLLATVGVLDEIDRAGFYRTTGNTVWWGSGERRVELFDPSSAPSRGTSAPAFAPGFGSGSGIQVFRPDLDQLLLDSAARAGAQVRNAATVRRARVAGEHALAEVEYEQDGQRTAAACRFVLDCSGRAGVLARRGYRRHERAGRMQAFIGVWHREAGWDLPDPTQTLVETYEDGWSWSVPISPSVRHVGAMLDATTTRITRGPTIGDAYRAELAKTREITRLMGDGDATLRHVWACDASLYDARVYAGPRFLLVGDAGSFIDPLSSFGVKKAIASAWLSAIVVHTCLTHPERQDLAIEFFSRWERQVYATNLTRTRDFARHAHAQHPHAFWATRARLGTTSRSNETNAPAATIHATNPADPAHAIDPFNPLDPIDTADAIVDDTALLNAPAVLEAFERVKRAPSLALVWADHVRFEKQAVIRGREIVLEDAVPLRSAGKAVRFLAGIDLVTLGNLACQHTEIGDIYDAYCRTLAPVPLPGFLGSLSLLVADGVLIVRS